MRNNESYFHYQDRVQRSSLPYFHLPLRLSAGSIPPWWRNGGRLPLLLPPPPLLAQVEHRPPEVVQHLEHRDDGEPHAEAQDPAAVGHEPDDGQALVPHYARHHGLLDVHANEGLRFPKIVQLLFLKKIIFSYQVVPGVVERLRDEAEG